MKRFLRRAQDGLVCYIPGISQRHPELEYEDVRQWAVKTNDGSVYPILYHPESFQPPKGIEFLGRTNEPGLSVEEELR
jgi:hypothetical protein